MSNGDKDTGVVQVQNMNDPVRIISAASTALTALITTVLASYVALGGKVNTTAGINTAGVVPVVMTIEDVNKEMTKRFDAIDAKLEYIKPAPKK